MENMSAILELVSSILPTDEEVAQAIDPQNIFQKCITEFEQLMDPTDTLSQIDITQQRGVCSTTWSNTEMAYGCRTCGIAKYAAICVSCFENGNHQDHIYFIIHNAGGCCDCGDVTAWKREGFCTNHGSEHIQPLDDELANSMGPVIDAIFKCWKNKLLSDHINYANELTDALVKMLSRYTKHSESLQRFISMKVMSSPGLLECLIKSERFLSRHIVDELHELLLKFLSEDSFRYEFAKEFLRYYPIAVKETIDEGDDYYFGELGFPMLCKFSMQIFPILTITRRLMEEENLLAVLFACLEDIFVACAGSDGRLEAVKWINFEDISIHVVETIRVVMSHVLQYIMVDEQINLSRTWLRLLYFIQGMYPFGRVTGTHTHEEFYRLEKVFLVCHYITNIHSDLVHGAFVDSCTNQIPEFVTWLASECSKAIENWYDPESQSRQVDGNFGILSLSEWGDITYDISSQKISLHLPLHHLLSVILRNALTRPLVSNGGIFRHLLGGCHPYGYCALIMEHPLRARAFYAQYRAGMWGDNGAVAMLYFEWYSSVCCLDGLESDLFLLQFCAAFAPPDRYIERIVERFGLSDYLSLDLQNSNEFDPALVRELMTFIIQIVLERRFCGLTPSQSLRRDLIRLLSVEDSTHSILMESLPRELSRDYLNEILETIAIYTDPSEQNEGIYSLRPTCWKEVDWYHPRWESTDLRDAEERYTRLCSVTSPPLCTQQLPKWTDICPPLQGVARIPTCRLVLQMIRAVLFKNANSNNASGSDRIVITTLHLLSLTLDICLEQSNQSSRLLILAFSDEEIGDRLERHSLLSLLVMLMRARKEDNPDNSRHFDFSCLIENLLDKFSQIDSSCKSRIQQLAPELVRHVASDDSDKSKAKAKAKERQAAVMAKMKAEQSKFLSNIDSIEFDGLKSVPEASGSKESLQVVCSLCHESSEDPVSFLIHLQKSRFLSFVKSRPSWDNEQATIQKHTSTTMTASSRSGMNPSSSGSSTPSTFKDRNIYSFQTFENDIYASFWREMHTKVFENEKLAVEQEEINQEEVTDFSSEADLRGFCPLDCQGIYISSCGHAMHQRCLDKFLSRLHQRVIEFEGPDSDQVEFLCPVCRVLANTVMPALPGDFHRKQSVDIISQQIDSLRLPQAVFLLQSLAKMTGNKDIFRAQRNMEISPNIRSVSRLASKMQFLENTSSLSPSLILWDALKYTVMSMEVASRCRSLSLDALHAEVESPTGFALSLLVKVVKSLESTNSAHVLQRFKGLRLFSKSICSGISVDFPGGQEDEMIFPDIQLWNRASEPILIHDPFSSLMWVLFFLPTPFMSCEETFMFLVHMFYSVAVVQALITYCAKRQFKIDDYCQYSLVNHMCEITGESGFSQRFFVSDYDVNQSDDNMVDVIHKLSLPYLRRCGLLWKLLTSSIPVPYTIDSDVAELEGVEELETTFKIPSIDMILKNEVLQSLALKWVRHFEKTFEARGFSQCDSFYSTLPIPFKLMQLPRRYEYLLQRYINKTCPACERRSLEPVLCLLCGGLLSSNKMPCCSESKCGNHAMECGAGIGVFLLIRSTRILLQRHESLALWPSPYLDTYGEEDAEMMRGVPLFLNEEAYDALAYMVASHSLDRNSKILGQPIVIVENPED